MEVVEINLVQLLKLGLNVNEYLTLLKLRLIIMDDIKFPFSSTEACLQSLITKGFLMIEGESMKFTSKGEKVFKEAGTALSESDFDTLFELYPHKTPGGRILRSKGKVVMGRLSKDYETLFRKYTSVIKNLTEHEQVLNATKNMVYDAKRRGASEFLSKMEVYVNQRGWEKFMDSTPIDLWSENVEKI